MDPNLAAQPVQPLPTVQSPTPPIIEGPPPKKKMPTMVALVLLVVLLVVLGGGTYVMNMKKSQAPTPTPVAKAKPSPTHFLTPSPTPIISATVPSDWKLYTGTNFSFQYPADAKVSKSQAASMLSKDMSDSILIERPYKDVQNQGYDIDLVVRDNSENLTAKTIIDNYITELKKDCSPPGCSTPNMMQNTLKSYSSGEINGYTFHIGAETDSVMVVSTKNNKLYVFRVSNGEGVATPEGIILFNNILSSMKLK